MMDKNLENLDKVQFHKIFKASEYESNSRILNLKILNPISRTMLQKSEMKYFGLKNFQIFRLD